MKVYAFLTLIVLAAGCKTTGESFTRTGVEKNMILPSSAQRTELETQQKFLMPVPINDSLPAFPLGYSSDNSDVTICADFVVTAEGLVEMVSPVSDHEGCESIESEAFATLFDEVKAALLTWTFFGAAICNFKTDEGECDAPDAQVTPTAVKLAYKFRFNVRSGRQSVESGTAPRR